MAEQTAPFAPFEWMIAWRYLRARRADGGVGAMTWISLAGIALAVFALVATLAVRSGFRAEFVDTILGANAHVTVYSAGDAAGAGRAVPGYDALARALAGLPGVVRAAPLVRGQAMASLRGRNAGVQVLGMSAGDLAGLPRIADPDTSRGDIARFGQGIAIGSGVARELGARVGDRIKLISPDGARTALGVSPRVNAYEVAYVFSAGRYDIDRVRVYLPLAEAQGFFNREGVADEIEVMVEEPEAVERYLPAILRSAGENGRAWTWKDASGAFLRALEVEDNIMFVILSVLVLVAAMNIVSGLVMLAGNKRRDIGILRTMGLTEGSVLRVFFLCGALTGVAGTAAGVAIGCLFAMYIDPLFALADHAMGGGAWDPSIRGIYHLPAELRARDVLGAAALSLGLSFAATLLPARRAARMDPVEALRRE